MGTAQDNRARADVLSLSPHTRAYVITNRTGSIQPGDGAVQASDIHVSRMGFIRAGSVSLLQRVQNCAYRSRARFEISQAVALLDNGDQHSVVRGYGLHNLLRRISLNGRVRRAVRDE